MLPKKPLHARDIMTKKPVVLDPHTSLYEASKLLVKNNWLSAPVHDGNGKFLGTFSQQSCMHALIDAVYEEIPSTEVQAYLDPNPFITHEDATLVKCCQLFADLTRRGPALVVLKEDVVVGLISRIDIIRGVLKYLKSAPDRKTRLLYLSALNKMGEETPGRMRDSAGTS
ncbi:MAG: CBS domain-containing protein [Planctomycetota bacterium]|jgi:predicted transcriptional regulator